MLNPQALVFFESQTEVEQDGYGTARAKSIAVGSWHGPEERFAPGDVDSHKSEPYYKLETPHGSVYAPDSDIEQIVPVDELKEKLEQAEEQCQ